MAVGAVAVVLTSTVAATADGSTLAAAIMEPTAGTSVSRSAAPMLDIAGAARFEKPTPSSVTFYVGGRGCHGDPLSTVPSGGGLGCLQYAESETPVNELSPERVQSDFTSEDGVPLTLDASAPVSGVVAISSIAREADVGFGAGLTTLDVTLTGVEHGATAEQAQTLGTATVSYIATPEQAVYTVPWSADVPAELDRQDFSSLTLSVVVRGYNVLHGGIKPRDTTVTVPTYTASFDRHVEVAIDDGAFSGENVILANDLTTWTTSIDTPAVGPRTLRARAVQGWRTSPVHTREITVTE